MSRMSTGVCMAFLFPPFVTILEILGNLLDILGGDLHSRCDGADSSSLHRYGNVINAERIRNEWISKKAT